MNKKVKEDINTKNTTEYQKDELKERVKELDCLYGLTDIVKDRNLKKDEALKRITELIPPAWQYPEITCSRITIDGKKFESKNFKETKWSQVSNIFLEDKKIGVLEVYYTKEKPLLDEGPFLIEERRLIDAISDLIGKYIGETRIKEVLTKSKKSEKQDWEVIIDLLIKTDPRTLLRMTRKMTYYLFRYENEKITSLLSNICPVDKESISSQWCGINMPNPRQDLDSLKIIQKQIFEIAKETIPPREISNLFQNWMKQDRARPLLLSSQKEGTSLSQIKDEINRFYSQDIEDTKLATEDMISIKTALIRRFFTNRTDYVNIAKSFIEPEDFIPLLNNTIGPAHGSGKLGGKTSGIFLAEKILKEKMGENEALKNISFPKSWYITSDTIINFIHYNDLDETFQTKYLHPDQIRQEQPFLEQVFKNATFPNEIVEGFRRIIRDLEGKPIIVRSSSLLEDSFGAAFSGKYKSLFVSNTGNEDERLNSLMDAIAEVYASTFGPDPIEYRRERGLIDFSEEMGILIQEVVGIRVGNYYLPTYSGVAFSKNEFQWSPRILREDGMIRLVPGLGTRAVDRVGNDYPILVSPKKPKLQVNALISEKIKYSPRYMDVINLKSGAIETIDAIDFLKEYYDEFPNVNQIISIHKDGRLVNPSSILLNLKESDMVVTFSNLFTKGDFLEKMKHILFLLEEKIGIPVDVEFASDGKKLYVLQCRPQSQSRDIERKPIPKNVSEDRKLFYTNKYVTTGQVENIDYIVYVVPEEYLNLETREEMQKISIIINELNYKLPKRNFILMGPGRWGSRGDVKLGVPVRYGDINNTSLLVEIAKEKGEYTPELSFGTHFFQDLVEAEIKYLPLYPDESNNIFNDSLLLYQDNKLTTILKDFKKYENVVRVIKISEIYSGESLSIIMDGEAGEALAYLKSPDHWSWRMQKVEEIAEKLDSELYKVESLYLIGSTKEGTAGPASDIDLLVHFKGNEEQREKLLAWFEKISKKFDEENRLRTGYKTSGILDIHIITDEDIKKKESWSAHLTSPYMSVKKIPLKKENN
jgi:predicted nucleotidyltransferase